uniref:Integrase catalytic domain-containing protein n=1 Tax=Tanacetum cinerariifolium TaxID=118510 RepID=A0A6L2MWS0_TANCI|nr:hypothetical protein [Tanacetum cinerariifolium]
MTTLPDKAIISGVDNRPPMLEKDMYDSWKIRMELYMMNRQHGRMILEFVQNGPLIWPTIEENDVIRPRKYSELTHVEAIQVDCDVKATNIILQGLPPEVYTLVSNHKVAKDLWESIQLLMQETSLTKQKRECKLYDEFDKFIYKKGETLHDFYLICSLLLNDMNIYNVKLEQFQINTKFLNTLSPKWSKFVTDVKLYGSPYQSQQYSTNPSSTPLLILYPSNDYQSSVHHNVYSLPQSIPQLEYPPAFNLQPQKAKFSQLDSGLTVLVFKQGDDPVDAINHMMSFVSAVVTSRYPTTNNQLRNSSNPRQQATINDGRVTLQLVQRRQISFATGHMSKQCIKPKKKWDDAWFKDKVLLLQAQINGQILHEEELAFLADVGIAEDSDCDELNTAKVSIMANLSRYGAYVLTEKAQQLEPKLYDGNVIENTYAIVILDLEETLMLTDESRLKMLLKQQDPMVLEKKNSMNSLDLSPSCRPTKVEVPKELPKVSMNGNVTISRVYYVKGLGHNLFSIGQFCDSSLEVAFPQHFYLIHNLKGVDLLIESQGNNSYTLSLRDMMMSSPISRHGLVRGLLKLKFKKDHMCFACAMGKSKKKPHKPKSEDTDKEKLYLLHMDLCGAMRIVSVNGKKYILVIVDDYSRFTYVKCFRSKDEAPDFIIKFLKMIQVRLKAPVRRIRTDNETEFVNQTFA